MRSPQDVDKLLSEPGVGRVTVGVRVPIEVGVERRHLEGKGEQLIPELRVEHAGVALRHRQQEICFAHDPGRGKVALAAQPDAATQIVAGKFEILGTQSTAARRNRNVLLRQIGLQRESAAEPRMPLARHHHQPFRAEPLPPDLFGQRQKNVDRRIERAGRKFTLEFAAFGPDAADGDARGDRSDVSHQRAKYRSLQHITRPDGEMLDGAGRRERVPLGEGCLDRPQ
jgi:hypothetical protein